MNKKLGRGVVIGVLIAVLASVIVIVMLRSGSPSPPATNPPPFEIDADEPEQTPESNQEEPEPTLPPMKTFTSTYYGVAVDYPESWRAEEKSYQGVPYEIFISDSGLIVQMDISTIDSEFQQQQNVFTPEDMINWDLKNVGGSNMELLTKPTTTTIQGYPACTVTYVKPWNGNWYKHIEIKKGNLIYSIRGLTQDPLYQPEIEAMLDSFRFIG